MSLFENLGTSFDDVQVDENDDSHVYFEMLKHKQK